MTILYRRALLLAKEEATFRTDSLPVEASDAILVSDPIFSADTSLLDRDNVKTHLSPDPGVAGRKIASISFAHEVRHNGNLDGTVPSKLGRLLEACAMSQTNIPDGPGGAFVGPVVPVNSPTCTMTGAVGTNPYDHTDATNAGLPRTVALICTVSGAPGAADFAVYGPASGGQAAVNLAATTLTNGANFVVDGATTPAHVQFTQTGTADVGDTFLVNLAPPGYYYEPISDPATMKSLTMYVYYDGLLHIMTGARGTFTVEGEAGDFARFNFTFTGDYADPTDTPMPTSPVYESTIPPQVELAAMLAAGGLDGDSGTPSDTAFWDLCAQSFSIDIGNNVVPRDCINEQESLAGAIITQRAPTAGFNPEVELEATHPFWANLSSAARVSWSLRVGSEQGNTVTFWSPYAQYSTLPYGNRNEIRTYEIAMRLNTDADLGGSGNDELRILFS